MLLSPQHAKVLWPVIRTNTVRNGPLAEKIKKRHGKAQHNSVQRKQQSSTETAVYGDGRLMRQTRTKIERKLNKEIRVKEE